MKVEIKSAVGLGGKSYAPGVQEVSDSLYANKYFQELVKSGAIVIIPRDEAAQKAQASKDARAALAAQGAEERARQAVAERAGGKNGKSFSGDKPELKSVDEAQAKLSGESES